MNGVEVFETLVTCLSPIIIAIIGFMQVRRDKADKKYRELRDQYDKEAEARAAKEKAEADARNEAEQMIFATEKSIKDLGDKLTDAEWNELKNNTNQPMYNRYLQAWAPGSTFKPVTGAIGLTSGKLSTTDEFYYTGLSWQKDSSWGNYNVLCG